MFNEQLKKLIVRLSDLTARGKVPWKEAERAETFLASFSGNSVTIGQRGSRQSRDATEYVVSVLDQFGDVIEEVGDEDFQSQEMFDKMKDLFERARRISRGIDDALESIMRELDEADDNPF